MAIAPAVRTPAPPAIQDHRGGIFRQMWRSRTSYTLLLVFFAPFVIFQMIPIVISAGLSMTNYNGSPTQAPEWVGTSNFTQLLSLEFRMIPRQVDEASGEIMFQCGRRKYTATEAQAQIAEGETCAPSYENPKNVLTDGYSEWKVLYTDDYNKLIIGAIDPRFWTAIYNTSIFVMFSVVARLVGGLFLALVLQGQSATNMILRTLFFLPSVTAGVAVTVVWGWIFRGQSYGLVNSMRLQMGATEVIPFLNDANWTMPILVFMAIWGGIGYNMILYLAGLQSIPAELYEAATVDGASTRDKFWHITLPLLRPTTVFLTITGIIGSFQVFDAVYILFAQAAQGMGGVLDSALTIVGYLYERGFRLFQLGYASSIALVLFGIIMVLTLINLRVGRSNEAY